MLVVGVVGCWMWERNVIGDEAAADDLMMVWSIYCWMCAPMAILLAGLYTKLYKRSPGSTAVVTCTLAAVCWVGFVLAVPSPRGDLGCVALLLLETYVLLSGVSCGAKSAFKSGAIVATLLSAGIYGRQQMQDGSDTGAAEAEQIQEWGWALVAVLFSVPLLVIGTLSALRRETARRLAYGWDRESEAAMLAAAGIGSGRRVETSRLLLLRVPATVMRRIFAGDRSLHDVYEHCAVLRVEISGFAELCAAREEEDEEDADEDGQVMATSGLVVALALLHDFAIIAEQLALRHGVVLLTSKYTTNTTA